MKDRDMVTKEEVKNFFQQKIKPKLGGLESTRKIVLRNIFIFHSIVAFLTFFAGNTFLDWEKDIDLVIKIILPLGFGLATFGQKLIVFRYRLQFKSEVIKDLFGVLIKDCVYKPNGKVSSDFFQDSKLVTSDFNKYTGEDSVKGKIGDIEVEFSEIRAIRETRDSKGRTQKVTVFRGLFYVFSLKVDLKQNTLILNDVAESLVGKSIGRFFQKKSSRTGYQLVQLESLEFEKKFVVYSDDQVKSRVLLKPSVLENLTSFKSKYREPIEVSIRGNKLYIGIQSTRNHFEPKLLGEVVSFHEIREIYDLVQLVRDLQEDLELESVAA